MAKTKPTTTPSKESPLTAKQAQFVREYLIDLNGTAAATRAGYSAHTAREIAHNLLTKVHIQDEIAAAQLKRQQRTEISADDALRAVWRIATADPRELVQVKVGCCRHCYGEGHKYQRTVGEMNRDREAYLLRPDAPEFDEKGGIGFNGLLLPSPECPECMGDGLARTVLMDTRNLSPNAAALYAGAKITKNGMEVVMLNKLEAMEKVFKHLGLYREDNAQRTDPLTTLLHTIAGGNSNGFKPVADDPERTED